MKRTNKKRRRMATIEPGSFPDLLKRYLKALDPPSSARKFAESVGISRSTFYDVLKGRRSPPLDKVDDLAQGFGLKGMEREQFVLSARSAKAKSKMDSAGYIGELERRLNGLEGNLKVAAACLRAVIAFAEESGVKIPEHSKQILALLEERVGATPKQHNPH